jgi:guanylate kinase
MGDPGQVSVGVGQAGTPPAVLLVLAGPAGAGKTTLCERLVAAVPDCARVVTATTRPPRPGETDGRDYHFLTPGQFDAKVAAGEFLEWACVHGRHRYGTLASAVLGPLSAGHSLVLNLDVQGVAALRRAAAADPRLARRLGTVFINVAPPAELRRRLTARGDNPGEIDRRMETAAVELLEKEKFDHVIESGSREADFQALLTIWRALQQRAACGGGRL